METVVLHATWYPKSDFKLGSRVWRNPRVEIEDKPSPKPGLGEVLIEVKACGICGSYVRIA